MPWRVRVGWYDQPLPAAPREQHLRVPDENIRPAELDRFSLSTVIASAAAAAGEGTGPMQAGLSFLPGGALSLVPIACHCYARPCRLSPHSLLLARALRSNALPMPLLASQREEKMGSGMKLTQLAALPARALISGMSLTALLYTLSVTLTPLAATHTGHLPSVSPPSHSPLTLSPDPPVCVIPY
ncbi:unnamed protein product [Closterium sp. Yama58-4]|nr:unnamed protein product [Closterium sp. Yama58-4]